MILAYIDCTNTSKMVYFDIVGYIFCSGPTGGAHNMARKAGSASREWCCERVVKTGEKLALVQNIPATGMMSTPACDGGEDD